MVSGYIIIRVTDYILWTAIDDGVSLDDLCSTRAMCVGIHDEDSIEVVGA